MAGVTDNQALVDPTDAPQDGKTAWARFAARDGAEPPLALWLDLTCRLGDAVEAGFVLRFGADGEPEAVSWPEGSGASNAVRELSESLLQDKCGLIAELAPTAEAVASVPRNDRQPRYALGLPVLCGDEVKGCACLVVHARDEEAVQEAMGQLQWSVAVLESGLYHADAVRAHEDAENLRNVIEVFAQLLAAERFEKASMQLATGLAQQLRCEKVSVGFVKRGQVRVQAVSHSAQHEKKMALIRRIENAMQEALAQRRTVLCTKGEDSSALIVREHLLLLEDDDLSGVLTVPLFDGDDYYGALCFERTGDERFDDGQVRLAEAVAQLAGQLLKQKKAASASILRKNFTALTDFAGSLVGPRHVGRKLIVLLLLVTVLLATFVKGEYWESGNAVLEGEVRRSIVVPFNGYLAEAKFRAGDSVAAGDVLARLEDRDLALEKLELISEQNQVKKQYLDAVSKHESVNVLIAKARLEQIEAQLEQVDLNIARTVIRAPLDGVITEGDLSQLLGSSVTKGDPLFVISPLDRYRVIVNIDERRINEIRAGQRAVLVLNAEPERRHEVEVTRVTPEVRAIEGSAFYKVEGELLEVPEGLRPGLEGIVKVYVDERLLVSIWTRGMVEWLKIYTWALFP